MNRPARLALSALALALALPGVLAPPANAVPLIATGISFTSPATATIGAYNWLTVSVSTADGTTRATGGVQFFNSAGQLVGTASTTPAGVSGATASVPWVPTQEIAYTFTATFLPSDPTLASSTTGAPLTVQATPNGQVVSIAVPQLYRGVPATLTATVFPSTLQGSVAFAVNNIVYGLGPSVPVVNGSASQTIIPSGSGWQQYIVSFTATNSPGTQGAVSQWVNVLPPLGTDDISLNPTPTSLANGTSVSLNATTVGGGSPTLTAAGGCTLSGAVLTATQGSGTCTVTGTSAASGGFLSATEQWAIPLTPGTQKAAVRAPASGPVKVGTSAVLSSSPLSTNAGQKVTWRVDAGASRCSISTRGGLTRVTFTRAGGCRVVGSANAVPGQWKAFRVTRTYTAA